MRPKTNRERRVNNLVLYRERMGLTQRHVAGLLGETNTTLISKLEQGTRLPSLLVILKLAIIYRAPVDFLFAQLYEELRSEIREKEDDERQTNAP